MVTFMLTITYIGPMGWNIVSGEQNRFDEGTKVAGVDIAQLNREEAGKKLRNRFDQWKKEYPVEVKLPGKTLSFQEEFVTISIEESLNGIVEGDNIPIVIDLNSIYFEDLKEQLPSNLAEQVQLDKFITKIEADAARLPDQSLRYSIYSFVPSGVEDLYESISTDSVEVKDVEWFTKYTKEVGKITINAGERISVLDTMDSVALPVDESNLHRIATVIYSSLLDTNFEIEERHISQTLPAFAELGREASVDSRKDRDFIARNPNQTTYEVVFSIHSSELEVEIRGYPLDSEVRSCADYGQRVEPRTIVHYSPLLVGEEVEVKQLGSDGLAVTLIRENREGNIMELIEDYYPPTDRKIVRSIDKKTQDTEGVTQDNEKDEQSRSSDDEGNTNTDDLETEGEGENYIWEDEGEVVDRK